MPQAADAQIRTWDEWMPALRFHLPMEKFQRLPRNAAYKYEYVDGEVAITPRPKHFHAILKINEFVPPLATPAARLRHFEKSDLDHIVLKFATAFEQSQPFSGLTHAERLQAARESLAGVVAGRDGPFLDAACFTALDQEHGPQGAVLVTRVIGGDPRDQDSYTWPVVCIPGEQGQPHLTWIFVAPKFKRKGVGSALLAASVTALADLGHRELWSTFLMGNDASMLWHWRNGFRLV